MPADLLEESPAYSFFEGMLRIRKPPTTITVRGWPDPCAMRRTDGQSAWESFQPEFRLVKPYRPVKKAPKKSGEEQLSFGFHNQSRQQTPYRLLTETQQNKRAFEQFRFSLPKRVAKIVEPFRTHQWAMLILLRYDPGAADLAEANPALAYFLAQKMRGDKQLIQSLKCSSMRQRDLLDVLGFEGSKKSVGLFRKVAATSITGDNWEAMVRLFEQELQRPKSPLNHLTTINSGVMEILLDPVASRAATPSLLEEVAIDKSERFRGRVVHMITSTMNMQQDLHAGQNWERFPSVERLRQVHEQVSENYRRRIRQMMDVSAHGSDSFRHPPIPGIISKIEPITSPEALVDEGEEQGNCVASYASRVKEGRTFIYKVLSPQRATLSIVRSDAGSDWEIGELESKFNTEATTDTEALVQAWLDRHQAIL